MVVGVGVGVVSCTWYEHITIFYDISTTSDRMVVVQIIVVELHYSILVIGWYFSAENGVVFTWMVVLNSEKSVAYVLMVVHCSPIYQEVLY